jgi:ribosomal protein S18 acetylase RimI-like enzyme
LINTAVIPEARRKGIHTALMMQRLVDAKKFGAKVAFYQTDFDNEASIGTGKKIGFEEGFRRRLFVKE